MVWKYSECGWLIGQSFICWKVSLLSQFDVSFVHLLTTDGPKYFMSFSAHSPVANTHLLASLYPAFCQHISHETAICPNPHSLSKLDARVNRHFCHKHAFFPNIVSTKNCFHHIFVKGVTWLCVGLLRVRQVFSVSYKIICRWVTTNCCSLSDISHRSLRVWFLWNLVP
jgi:hypothetical protein